MNNRKKTIGMPGSGIGTLAVIAGISYATAEPESFNRKYYLSLQEESSLTLNSDDFMKQACNNAAPMWKSDEAGTVRFCQTQDKKGSIVIFTEEVWMHDGEKKYGQDLAIVVIDSLQRKIHLTEN